MNPSTLSTNKFTANFDVSPKNAVTIPLAPLRFEAKASYNAPPEKLFAMVSKTENLHLWLAMLKTAKIDHSHSKQSSQCDVGSLRQCSFSGMGDVDERIIWWNPPHSYGFSFSPKGKMKMMIPTTDQVTAFTAESDGNGGSILTMQLFFHWRESFMRHIAAHMMPMILNKSLSNLQKILGGTGGKFRRIA